MLEPPVVDAIAQSYRSVYDGGGCLRAQLFPGIAELLSALAHAGKRCFVVTNKPALPAKLLLSHFAIDRYFERIASPDDPVQPFSDKADAVAELLRAKAIDSGEACVIGDAVDDARAASVNKVAFVAAAYGYGEAHKQQTFPIAHIAYQPADLLALLR
jgi:phosphoglycolate phosphatase